MENIYFLPETFNYLQLSFEKVDFKPENLARLFEWLGKAPMWTTIRWNKNCLTDSNRALESVQQFLEKSYANLNKFAAESTNKIASVPQCKILNELIDECITFNSCVSSKIEKIEKLEKIAIIDLKCAQSVLRGADIFLPGVLSLSMCARANDPVSVYADLSGKCLKGADANSFSKSNPTSLYFVGNGWLLHDRDWMFKQDSESKSGVGVKMSILVGNYYIPSMDQLERSSFFLQNLPSIICARVLDPQPNELILDMCCAPGGKTTHIAELVNNKSRIIAFDKIASKIEKMKELCATLQATCIECVCQDGTKINFDIYKPESFDRILVDAPCSALGQRPLIFNDITPGQLKSYIVYQRKLLENAVKLLKLGGTLVYSTCTITIEENEEQVSWLLNKFKNMKLLDQNPFKYSASEGLDGVGLSPNQAKLVQRFMPFFGNEFKENDKHSVFLDTNGFFISKFFKEF